MNEVYLSLYGLCVYTSASMRINVGLTCLFMYLVSIYVTPTPSSCFFLFGWCHYLCLLKLVYSVCSHCSNPGGVGVVIMAIAFLYCVGVLCPLLSAIIINTLVHGCIYVTMYFSPWWEHFYMHQILTSIGICHQLFSNQRLLELFLWHYRQRHVMMVHVVYVSFV